MTIHCNLPGISWVHGCGPSVIINSISFALRNVLNYNFYGHVTPLSQIFAPRSAWYFTCDRAWPGLLHCHLSSSERGLTLIAQSPYSFMGQLMVWMTKMIPGDISWCLASYLRKQTPTNHETLCKEWPALLKRSLPSLHVWQPLSTWKEGYCIWNDTDPHRQSSQPASSIHFSDNRDVSFHVSSWGDTEIPKA